MDEDSVVPGLTAGTVRRENWGWYFQQAIKLGYAAHARTNYYACVDADTIFLRRTDLLDASGRPQYATGTEFHKPYFDTFRELLEFSADRKFSYIAHHMIFNRAIVSEMLARFRPLPRWGENISNICARGGPPQAFSEYETYGHYAAAMHPGEITIRPLRWMNVGIAPTPRLLRRLARDYDFCSFHAYSREGLPMRTRILRRARLEVKIRLAARRRRPG
jgi:hypothetical protein